jgi:F-type H+-transporting ATPase subunit b
MRIRNAQILIAASLVVAAFVFMPALLLGAEEETASKWGVWLTAGRWFNLGLVILVLVWVGRKPLAAFCANRTQAIRDQLEEAQAARREAESKLAEAAERMKHLQEELQEIKATGEREAQEEYRRLLAVAEKDADKIIERAKQEIEGMTRAARNELKEHVAGLAVQLAEDKIRNEMTAEDRTRLFERFVDQLRQEK